ncbi:hypothetical protein HNR70_002822 [Brachybacterium aquaticum]|uniref:DUF222 domain-containing protein n=1 Tax=Brachybacterium aquaticum TaxID=1432564 RepID=A0A841ACN2_9MICO|nr:HNH endonuclease signature motif containing protein [Brachybacterium aquaticum]MBB5833009.1 hypothetical protein [Brachybacterium aquaticum]
MDDAEAVDPSDSAPEPARSFHTRARRKLDASVVVEDAGGFESPLAGSVLEIHLLMRERAHLYGLHLQLVADLFTDDSENEGSLDWAEVTAVKIATGLRVSNLSATALVHDAHRAVKDMPSTFAVLLAGDMPESFHRYLLRHARRLTPEQARRLDEYMAGVEIANVPQLAFEKQVRVGTKLVTAGAVPILPSKARSVDLVGIDEDAGTATLTITGPILEIKALMHRLDVAAHTVQKEQRRMLQDEEEGPLPFDLDDVLREQGRPMSLRHLRYAILTHSVIDIDPVQETTSAVKLLMTVPVTTMMGYSNTPAMLEGMTPIPAEQARRLAAGEKTWQRILTDPITGAYLPVNASTYTPTAQMRLQLRLRHPVCAMPGCDRPTVLMAEDDHILEYDHDHPDEGGQTSLFNLHRLCHIHHQVKTKQLLDPVRDEALDPARGDGTTIAGPYPTTWHLGDGITTTSYEDTDLLTPIVAAELEMAARIHERTYAEKLSIHEQLKALTREQRIELERRRIIPPHPDYGEPPF